MPRPIRRVVTGHDGNGKAVVVMDGPAPNVVTSRHRPGARTNLWRTGPASREGERDEAAADVKFTLEPLSNGTNFRISEYPPETEADAEIDGEKAFAEVGAAHRIVKGARHPFMHRTDTVDYAIVLEGEIVLLLDEEDIHLKAGDVVIQRGTNHAWANRSDKLCRIAFILVDAGDGRGREPS